MFPDALRRKGAYFQIGFGATAVYPNVRHGVKISLPAWLWQELKLLKKDSLFSNFLHHGVVSWRLCEKPNNVGGRPYGVVVGRGVLALSPMWRLTSRHMGDNWQGKATGWFQEERAKTGLWAKTPGPGRRIFICLFTFCIRWWSAIRLNSLLIEWEDLLQWRNVILFCLNYFWIRNTFRTYFRITDRRQCTVLPVDGMKLCFVLCHFTWLLRVWMVIEQFAQKLIRGTTSSHIDWPQIWWQLKLFTFSYSSRCCPTVEHSAAERHVGVVNICFQETFEDSSFQSFFHWISYSACAVTSSFRTL